MPSPYLNNETDNEIIKKFIKEENVIPCNIWVGDEVYFNSKSKEIVLKKYGPDYWDEDADKYLYDMNIHRCIVGYKSYSEAEHGDIKVWWSRLIINEKGRETLWFVDDSIFKRPTYNPKKIERTLESYLDSNREYSHLIIHVKNKLYKKLLKYLFSKLDYTWCTGDRDTELNTNKDIYIFLNKEEKYIFYENESNLVQGSAIKHVIERDNISDIKSINTNIYEYDEKLNIPTLFLKPPSYNPKKMERTLEKFNTAKDAHEVFIKIDTYDEYLDFKEKEFENHIDYNWSQCTVDINNRFPLYLFFNLGTELVLRSDEESMKRYLEDNLSDSVFDYVYNHVYTMNDIDIFLQILKTGEIPYSPSYKPRKIERTLEESEIDYLRFIPQIPPILTEEEQREMFKLGDIVYIRPDAFDYFYDLDPIPMEEQLGGKVKIIDIEQVSDRFYDYSEEEMSDLGKDLKSTDLLFTCEPIEHEDWDAFYWSYRCLFNPKSIKPNYNPKNFKINESKKSVINSYYFSKYNTLMMKFNKNIDKYKYDNLVSNIQEIFEIDNEVNMKGYRESSDDNDNDEEFIYYIKVSGNNYDYGWDNIKYLNYDTTYYNLTYPKVFTIEYLGSKEHILSILNTGNVMPSYEPRKIHRLLDENADYIETVKNDENLTLSWSDKDAIPFVVDNGKLLIGENGTEHYNIWKKEIEDVFRIDYHLSPSQYQNKYNKISPPVITIRDIEEYYDVNFNDYYDDLYSDEFFDRLSNVDYSGRLWLNSKIISFWSYPKTKEEFKKIIKNLEDKLEINIWNDEWYVSIMNDEDEDILIPIMDFEKSENISDEEWKQHMISPLLKKRKIIHGFGSDSSTYKNHRIWQMASLTDESVNNINESINILKNKDEVKRYSINNDIKVPSIEIGDTAYFIDCDYDMCKKYKELGFIGNYDPIIKYIGLHKGKKFNVISKLINDSDKKWWSMIEVDNDRMYLPDNLLRKVSDIPTYQPRIIKRDI